MHMSMSSSEAELRRQICAIGQKLYDKGFVAANDGNISARLNENTILITPTGVSKGGMDPGLLVKMELNGNIVSGTKPSSEVKLHLEVYKQDPAVRAVVHSHPPLATAFAVAGITLDRPILAEMIATVGDVPISDYALPGSKDLPLSIAPHVKNHNAVLLANHGLLTWGNDLEQAYFRTETIEHYCKIRYYASQIGTPNEFNQDQMHELIRLRTGGSV